MAGVNGGVCCGLCLRGANGELRPEPPKPVPGRRHSAETPHPHGPPPRPAPADRPSRHCRRASGMLSVITGDGGGAATGRGGKAANTQQSVRDGSTTAAATAASNGREMPRACWLSDAEGLAGGVSGSVCGGKSSARCSVSLRVLKHSLAQRWRARLNGHIRDRVRQRHSAEGANEADPDQRRCFVTAKKIYQTKYYFF